MGAPIVTASRPRLRQPAGLTTLAMMEMWERFSFYGMVSILVLYFIAPPDGGSPPGPGFGFSNADAAALFGCYSALIFATPLVGGWIGDRLLGPRRTLVIGAVVIASGHFVLLVPGAGWFWTGLLLVAMGTGLLKPNISAVLADLYTDDDPRRDGGFSLFYMGINIGAFLAPLICGYIAMQVSWRLAFSVAGFGMVLGLIQYAFGRSRLGSAGVAVPKPADASQRQKILLLAAASVAGIAFLFWAVISSVGFSASAVTALVTFLVIVVSIVAFSRLLTRPGFTPLEKANLRGFLVLFITSAIYFVLSSQAGSTINEFTQQWIRRSVGSFEMPSSWLLSLNPVLVVVFAPLFALLWTRLAQRAPSTPLKLALSLVGVGLSFLIIAVPGFSADQGQSSALMWVLATFLVLTWAELLIVPIALSTTTKLAPPGLAAQLLGLWYLAAAVGGAVGGQAARLEEPLGMGWYFLASGLFAMLLGLVFVLLLPRLRPLFVSSGPL